MGNSAWWSVETLVCRNCQGLTMKDMTAKYYHKDENPERILWCLTCGAICTPHINDPIGSDDWYTPELSTTIPKEIRNPVTGRYV